LTGEGVIYLYTDHSSRTYVDAEMIEVVVSVSWQDRNGRIMGEDLDLDGTLDGGEDTNSDGELSSPVSLRTFITRR
jgi:hypothetical protein